MTNGELPVRLVKLVAYNQTSIISHLRFIDGDASIRPYQGFVIVVGEMTIRQLPGQSSTDQHTHAEVGNSLDFLDDNFEQLGILLAQLAQSFISSGGN